MINRLSYSRLGNISFIARETISYFDIRRYHILTSKYDIVSRAIKLISPRLSYDNLYLSTAVMDVILPYLQQSREYMLSETQMFVLAWRGESLETLIIYGDCNNTSHLGGYLKRKQITLQRK